MPGTRLAMSARQPSARPSDGCVLGAVVAVAPAVGIAALTVGKGPDPGGGDTEPVQAATIPTNRVQAIRSRVPGRLRWAMGRYYEVVVSAGKVAVDRPI
jgi:hypothetical protein